MIGFGLGDAVRIEAVILEGLVTPVDLWFPVFSCRRVFLAVLPDEIDPLCLERAHYSRIGITEWPHQNQTPTKFRG